MNGTKNGVLTWWQQVFPIYLGVGIGILILLTSYISGSSLQTVVIRTLAAGFGMFVFGKLTGAMIYMVWDQPEIGGTAQENLGQNIDIRLEQEQGINSQIDSNLQQMLEDNPQRLADLAKKMGFSQ